MGTPSELERFVTLTIGLLGDVMLGRRVGQAVRTTPPEQLWARDVKDIAASCDLLLCNLECCVSGRGRRTDRIRNKPFFFRAPPQVIDVLKAIDVSAVGLANNHVLDFEEEGLIDTLGYLAEAGIPAFGAGRDAAEAQQGIVLRTGALRLGVFALTDHPRPYAAGKSSPGVAYMKREGATPEWLYAEVGRLRRECDQVIAFLHWGPNNTAGPAAWQRRVAAELQTAGVDLIAGHSAHVFHGIEWSSGGPVLYDLGGGLDDYRAIDPDLRNDLGLFALWRPHDAERQLELVGLHLDHCYTRLATGPDADWMFTRLQRSCAEFGVQISRVGDQMFRVGEPVRKVNRGQGRVKEERAAVARQPVLWTAPEIVGITGGFARQAQPAWEVNDVSYITRRVRSGDLFVATKTPYVDGHKDAPRALASGAAAALVSKGPDDLLSDPRVVVVENTMAALERLAKVGRERSEARVAAVTGSVGKTFTKNALWHVLDAQAPTFATRGNENDDQGALVSVARLPSSARFGVFELCIVANRLKMNGLRRKSRWVRPHVAVITRIGKAHLEYYDSIENIADAKAKIFEGLEPGGYAVLNRDDPLFGRLTRRALEAGVERVTSFGEDPGADARLLEVTARGQGQSWVRASVHGRSVEYELGATGSHNVHNSLAVLAAVHALGAEVDAAAAALGGVQDSPGRGNRYEVPVPGGDLVVIDASRNADPLSMRASITSLRETSTPDSGRRIAVLGDIKALGDQSAQLHAELAEHVMREGIDLVFTAGEEMSHLHSSLPPERRGGHATTADALIAPVVREAKAGDAVVVQGARVMKMSRVVRALVGPDGFRSWS